MFLRLRRLSAVAAIVLLQVALIASLAVDQASAATTVRTKFKIGIYPLTCEVTNTVVGDTIIVTISPADCIPVVEEPEDPDPDPVTTVDEVVDTVVDDGAGVPQRIVQIPVVETNSQNSAGGATRIRVSNLQSLVQPVQITEVTSVSNAVSSIVIATVSVGLLGVVIAGLF